MKNASTFEILYHTYSKMLYGIALEISSDQKEAEEILINTFQKAYKQKITRQNYPSVCITLIRLIIQSAKERPSPNQQIKNFKLKQFDNTPLLHKILCDQISLEQCSEESKLSRNELSKKLRIEVLALRKLKNINDQSGSGAQL